MNSAIIHKGTQTPGRPLSASCAVHGCTSAASAGCAGAALPQHSCIHAQRRDAQEQQGSVLIVSMLILLVLTLIGVTAMGTSALEEKMAGNSRDQNQAFQAAEAALRDAETLLNGIVSTAAFDAACTNGLCAQGINPVINAATWAGANSQVYVGPALPGINTQPRYIIQVVNVIGNAPPPTIGGYGSISAGGRVTLFLITARGTGGTDNATVTLQEHFGRAGI